MAEQIKDEDVLVAHGLTRKELDKFHVNQIQGNIGKVDANMLDTIKDPYWKEEYEDYQVNEADVYEYHVIQESRGFNEQTGERTSYSMVQQYNPEMFALMVKNGGFAGMLTQVIHSPIKEGKSRSGKAQLENQKLIEEQFQKDARAEEEKRGLPYKEYGKGPKAKGGKPDQTLPGDLDKPRPNQDLPHELGKRGKGEETVTETIVPTPGPVSNPGKIREVKKNKDEDD